MQLSIDLGGSTSDVVVWDGDEISEIHHFESDEVGIEEILNRFPGAEKVFVTGGKSRFLDDDYIRVGEIDAIGAGGAFLVDSGQWTVNSDGGLLVVSMGTGTCMVVSSDGRFLVEGREARHVGGTGVGGGTFVSLGKRLLGISEIEQLLEIGAKGEASSVDISVQEIVGSGIGLASADATASNLGKLASEIDFRDEDVAAGIINLVGQTIGVLVAQTARVEGLSRVVLVGKLTRADAVLQVVKEILASRDIEVVVPKNAEAAVAIGAKVAYNFSANKN